MVIRSRTLATASSALLLGGLLAGGVRSAAAPAPATAMLTLDPQAALKTVPMYLPTPITLAAAKPGSVKKEPAYRAVPKYGTIKLGNDPSGTYVIAVDEPADADWKIYLDANRNGDLTDDGDGAWASKKEGNGRTQYGPSRLILDAAWTLADGKKSAAKYGISMYRFSNSPVVFMYGEGVRTGTITLDGKPHKMALLETAYDAVYSKPPVASIEESKKARAIWLVVDLDDNGKFDYQGAERVDPR
ncbi:MAG: hypothetical protein K0Q72_4459, partial [Armatimonadetes bacterium]|nr:hypothetical protein [Armatimonadota bacterium]